MKNLLIGFMIGYWVSPVAREVVVKTVEKLSAELKEEKVGG